MFFEIAVLKSSAIFTGIFTCVGSLFDKVAGLKLLAWRPAIVLKRDSSTGVFLRILQNFEEQLFWVPFFVEHLWWQLLKRNVASLKYPLLIEGKFFLIVYK